MKQWFLRPLLDIDLIKERQDVVLSLTSSENTSVLDTMKRNLGFIKNIPVSTFLLQVLLSNLRKNGSLSNWQNLQKFFLGFLKIVMSLRYILI